MDAFLQTFWIPALSLREYFNRLLELFRIFQVNRGTSVTPKALKHLA